VVQTFVPYADLRTSCVVLDDRRLGKQRVETYQILRALTWPQYAWKNHPAVRMWRGFVPALVEYGLENCREWTRRGYADAVGPQLLGWTGGRVPVGAPLPPWWGWEDLHRSHRSALLRKDPQHYAPLLGDEPDDLPYLWPTDVFPRWPVRGGPDGLPAEAALRRLGLNARPGQLETAAAAAAARDVLLVARPGSGGSTAALLAGLRTPGRTLWIAPPWGPAAGPVPAVELPAPRVVAAQGDRPPPIARSPGPEDLDAMQTEQAEPEFVFRTPATAERVERQGLVVIDRAHEMGAADGALVRAARGPSPAVVVVPRADAASRAELVQRFGLRSPVRAGGGWDVEAVIEVVAPASPGARRPAAPSRSAQLCPCSPSPPGPARCVRAR